MIANPKKYDKSCILWWNEKYTYKVSIGIYILEVIYNTYDMNYDSRNTKELHNG
jgi:hypothetical protein